MNVFVTGASGSVGRPLVQRLIEEGHTVTALAHTPSAVTALGEMGATVLRGDLLQRAPFANEMRECDGVVHLAGSAPDEEDPAVCKRLDIEGTQRLLESVPRDRLKRFVFASTAAVMGEQGGDWTHEGLPVSPQTPHAEAKLRVEKLLANSTKLWGLPVVTLRLAHVYGAGSFFGRLVEHMRDGDLALSRQTLETQWGLVSAHDAARAFGRALEHGQVGQTYFVADDRPQPLETVLETVANSLGLNGVKYRASLLRRGRVGREYIRALGGSVRPRNEKLKRELHFEFFHPDLAKGLRAMAMN